jgi:HTH-type transcriptional regulator/antitoxin HigA
MSNKNGSDNLGDWIDFSVPGNSAISNASDLYESYKVYKDHLKSIPKSELVKRGWIASKEDSVYLVDYFRDIHAEKGQALYRKANTANASLVSLWLSKVKSQAEVIAFLNSAPKFLGLSKDKLHEIARLSVNVNVLAELPRILFEYGIILVYMHALPGMKLDGAVFKGVSGNPIIGMSLRYPRLDNFWFTLLHELSHIHLHLEILGSPILEDFDVESDSEIEISANRLAKNSFVERSVWRNCEPKYNKSFDAIDEFANQVGVHRSIIAGMLQREFGNYASYSKNRE